MEKEYIDESMKVHESWYAEAIKLDNKDDLSAFIDKLMTAYSHDGATVIHAMVAGLLGTITVMNKYPEGGIGSGQKLSLMTQFVRMYLDAKGPMKVVNWFGMLNPDNEWAFTSIPKKHFLEVVEAAKHFLAGDLTGAKPHHVEHLKKVAQGDFVPFNYTIGEDKK